jgi:hypothetical protein
MKRVVLFATLVSVGCGLAESQRAMAAQSPAAVIMSCSGNPSQTQTNYTVLTIDSSPSFLPPFSTGGSCAAAIASLVSQEFRNVKQVNANLIDLLVFTFIRDQFVVLD